jgi:hypothetical protein
MRITPFLSPFLLFVPLSDSLPAEPLGHTFFQTNEYFDPRITLDVDFLVVHRHGDPKVGEAMESWQRAGYKAGRMFFIGSDAGRLYTTGKWDGKEHLDETEVDKNGKPIECGGERPYMIPTEGWKAFVHEQIKQGIDAGAVCILPEEPLAHVNGGYGGAFKHIWEQRYGKPWEPPDSSPDNYYKSSKLLCDLYFELVEDALAYTKQYAAEKGCDVKFLLPIHPLLSHAVGHMTYASGRTLSLVSKGLDGFVGQVWTGPIAWGMSRAEGKRMDRNADFFESAYLMYSYFANLVKGTGIPCYMLADPVEDDPQYSWEDYRKWYNQCLAAMLQFPWMRHFEVMPWPDRVFLPGFSMASGTPGPEDYRRALMIAFATLKCIGEATDEDANCDDGTECVSARIGYLVSDTLSWQRGGPEGSRIESVHGFTVPLLRRGIPIDLVPLERHADQKYMDGFKTLVLSYDAQKPLDPQMNIDLAEWVRRGGNLVYLGGEDAYNAVDEWWRRTGYTAPQDHLWEELGIWKKGEEKSISNQVVRIGEGRLLWYSDSAASLADHPDSARVVLDLLQRVTAAEQPPAETNLFRQETAGVFSSRSCTAGNDFEGEYLDLLNPNIPLLKRPAVGPQSVGCFRRLPLRSPEQPGNHLLFSAPDARHISDSPTLTRMELRSPDNTPATLRLACLQSKPDVSAKSNETGEPIQVRQEYDAESDTLLLIVPAGFKGAIVDISWQ